MGILMLLVYLAMLASSAGGEFLQRLLHSDPSEWFALWFGSVSGVIGLIALFVFCNTKVWYTPEGLTLKYPLRRKQELLWSQIQKIETVLERKQGRTKWKKLSLYTKDGVYRINLEFLTWGKDGFMVQLYKMIDQYDIPCMAVDR